MPFAGSRRRGSGGGRGARAPALCSDGDELILADNCRRRARTSPRSRCASTGVRAIDAPRRALARPRPERRAAARRRRSEWILFLDADTVAPADLLRPLLRRADRRRRRRGRWRDRRGAARAVCRDRRPLRRAQELPRRRRPPRAPVHAARRGRQPARPPCRVRRGRRLLRGAARGRGHRLQLAAAAARAGRSPVARRRPSSTATETRLARCGVNGAGMRRVAPGWAGATTGSSRSRRCCARHGGRWPVPEAVLPIRPTLRLSSIRDTALRDTNSRSGH